MIKHGMLAIVLSLCVAFTGCIQTENTYVKAQEQKRYEARFIDVFDTVTTIIGYDTSEAFFSEKAQYIHDTLMEYHQFFDIYKTYPGINNLKTVNDKAGIEPVKVDERIVTFIEFCKEMDTQTGGLVNISMGSVLKLWHDARENCIEHPENAKLPDMQALKSAEQFTDFSKVFVDAEASTIYISDANMRLDVGAIAKGYALEQVCQSLPDGLLISVGGNVFATGPKTTDVSSWVVGIQDPDEENGANVHTLSILRGAVVTSGDYQRYYTVNGERYHHIIDPETLMPAKHWRCVTVICPDSGIADALSTALFLMPKEDGEKLLEVYGAEALWIDAEGNEFYSEGFEDYLRT